MKSIKSLINRPLILFGNIVTNGLAIVTNIYAKKVKTRSIYEATEGQGINVNGITFSKGFINNAIIDWDSVVNKPSSFPSMTHYHDSPEMIATEYYRRLSSAHYYYNYASGNYWRPSFLSFKNNSYYTYLIRGTKTFSQLPIINYDLPTFSGAILSQAHVQTKLQDFRLPISNVSPPTTYTVINDHNRWVNTSTALIITLPNLSTLASGHNLTLMISSTNSLTIVKVQQPLMFNYVSLSTGCFIIGPNDGEVLFIGADRSRWYTSILSRNYKQYGFICSGVTNSGSVTSSLVFDTTTTASYISSTLACHSGSGSSGVVGPQYGFVKRPGNSMVDYFDLTTSSNNTIISNFSMSPGDSTGNKATCSDERYGYFSSGSNGSNYVNTIIYIDMLSTSNSAVSKGTLPASISFASGLTGQQYGFVCGGRTSSTQYLTPIYYFDLTTNSSNASSRGALTTGGQSCTQFSNIPQGYGFIAGGYVAASTYTNRIEYLSTLTLTVGTVANGTLSSSRAYIAGVSSPQYGFACGGTNTSRFATVDMLDLTVFSTSTTSTTTSLPEARNSALGLGTV